MRYLTSSPPVELDRSPDAFAADTTSKIYRIPGYKVGQKAALHALQQGRTMLYAMRLRDGLIKIGITADVAQRRMQLRGEILGFTFGDLADELAIHHALAAHVHHGREWYNPTPEVMAVVNGMRENFGLDPLPPKSSLDDAHTTKS